MGELKCDEKKKKKKRQGNPFGGMLSVMVVGGRSLRFSDSLEYFRFNKGKIAVPTSELCGMELTFFAFEPQCAGTPITSLFQRSINWIDIFRYEMGFESLAATFWVQSHHH